MLTTAAVEEILAEAHGPAGRRVGPGAGDGFPQARLDGIKGAERKKKRSAVAAMGVQRRVVLW